MSIDHQAVSLDTKIQASNQRSTTSATPMLCHGLGNVGMSFLRHPNGMGILEIHGVVEILIQKEE